jgi:hypothetical protein
MERNPVTMRLGVTGHMNLTEPTQDLVRERIREYLSTIDSQALVGVSCIAAGADSLFAEEVLKAGGTLEVVLPCRDYRGQKVKPENLAQFDRLVSAASRVHEMDYDKADRFAYEAANTALLGMIDTLVAVWDGDSPVDRGGTAAVVHDARCARLDVKIIWPSGAQRRG